MTSKLHRGSAVSSDISLQEKIDSCARNQMITSLIIAAIALTLIVTIKKQYRFILGVSGGAILIINSGGYLYIRSLKNAESQAKPTVAQACAPKQEIRTNAVAFSEVAIHPDISEFFQFLKPAERAEIQRHYNHPLQSEIIRYIQSGDWVGLVSCYQQNDTVLFYKILDATFLQRKLDTIDDLVTAYMAIANSEASQKGDCNMISYEDAMRCGEWRDLEKRFPNIEGVPKNQLCFFEMNTEKMTDNQRRLVHSFFDLRNRSNFVVGGILDKEYRYEKERYLIASAALMRKDSRLTGSLRFVYKLPRRSTVCKYILKREHIISLLHAEDEKNIDIHGQHLIGLLGWVHDGYHADVRSKSKLFEEHNLLHTGLAIGKLLETVPRYSSNEAILSRGVIYRRLTKQATDDDKVRFFLEEILQHIIDGENFVDHRKATVAEHLESMLGAIINNDYSLCPFIVNTLSTYLQKIGYIISSERRHFEVRALPSNQSLRERNE